MRLNAVGTIVAVGLATLAAALAVEAQPPAKVPRIGSGPHAYGSAVWVEQ
jgi:hypothetical protein